jgi:SDR family mycofactocin-dependent oxidoreductase
VGQLDGKVVFISGVARGQGRSHALRFAAEGADVIGFDIASQVSTAPASMGSREDMRETVRLVEEAGGKIVTAVADVRDQAEVDQALASGLDRFDRVDIVIANAGIGQPYQPAWQIPDEAFRNTIDVNLVGAWHTAKAAIPHMIDHGEGGSIVLTGSGASVKGLLNMAAYVASKHGLIGMMRSMAKELGPYQIRVNAVLPGKTNTPMFMQGNMRKALLTQDQDTAADDQAFLRRAAETTPMVIPYVEPEDVAEAALWLSLPASRYVTGTAIPVDGGTAIP